MRLIKQKQFGQCLAACVAMVADCTLEEVIANCRMLTADDGITFLPDNEAIKFLASRMLCYGLRIQPGQGKLTADHDVFTVQIPLGIAPAILSVPSKNFPGMLHAVVWDNETRKVLDPLADEPRELADYDVKEWCMVSHI